MILVVFGAGASYDSVPSKPPGGTFSRERVLDRLPLADELFLETGLFESALEKFPQCHPIVPYLRETASGVTIENKLEKLQTEGETDDERLCQLAAIRFYLQLVIWSCENAWRNVAKGITNYVVLLDQLRRCRNRDEPVLLATFNYDRMIESALESVGIVIDSMPKYIQSETFKLFKLHGSVNWGREVKTDLRHIAHSNSWQVCSEVIRLSPELEITENFHMAESQPIGRYGAVPLFPAIAIPVERKSVFECPSDHLDCLKQHLKMVTKIILVGWRGAERHFLDLLGESLRDGVSVFVVAGSRSNAKEVLKRFDEASVPVVGHPYKSGFTDFANERGAENFLL